MNNSPLTYQSTHFYSQIRMVKSTSSETETEGSVSEQEIDQTQQSQEKSPKSAPDSLCSSPHQAKLSICKIQPIKGAYYKNRVQFFNWMRKECTKLQLSVETFAGAVGMMDRYFKQTVFNVKDFTCIALCMLVISSKINQTKILYTPIMAMKSKIPPLKMQETELAVMVWFKFKVNAYNYARIVMDYMRVWDEIITQYGLNRYGINFLQQERRSYLLVQEVLFACEQQLKHNKQLLRPTLKIIFRRILNKGNELELQPYIHMLFQLNEAVLANAQYEYVFECIMEDSPDYPIYISKVEEDVSKWIDQFSQLKPSLEKRYYGFQQDCTNYGHFLGLVL